MTLRSVSRVAVAVVVLAALATVGHSYATWETAPDGANGLGAVDGVTNESVAPPRGGVTVVATDSNSWLGLEGEGPRANAELFAVGPDGRVIYYNDSHTRYWDVDPVEGARTTVEYVYADHRNASECGGESVCTENGVERVNLTTGAVTDVFSRLTPGKHSTRWHDVDRVSDHELVVADIAEDRVFRYNASADVVEWAWDAQAAFDPATTGGPYPEDWTHLNDVEVLDDGRVMASLRNHDQVVFIDPETGLLANETLGADGDQEVLYEQHNPDHISSEHGGPAVLVADSERNRVVEYRRVDDGWRRSWEWRDSELQWPRDADRLPNGNTLVTDSNGDRVLEVDARGDVVWEVPVAFPYEAERLSSGDESAGGPATGGAAAASGSGDADGDGGTVTTGGGDAIGDGASDGETAGGVSDGSEASGGRAADGEGGGDKFARYVSAVRYVLPVWMSEVDLAALVLLALTLPAWLAVELYVSAWTVSTRWPVTIRRGGR